VPTSAGGTKIAIDLERQGLLATSAVIGIGFLASYIGYFAGPRGGDAPPFTGTQLLVATFLGVIYLILSLVNEAFWTRYFGRYATLVAFTVLILLAIAIQTILVGSFAIWLVSMPLVGSAAVDLRRPWCARHKAAATGIARRPLPTPLQCCLNHSPSASEKFCACWLVG
jgi:hypothetical protein